MTFIRRGGLFPFMLLPDADMGESVESWVPNSEDSQASGGENIIASFGANDSDLAGLMTGKSSSTTWCTVRYCGDPSISSPIPTSGGVEASFFFFTTSGGIGAWMPCPALVNAYEGGDIPRAMSSRLGVPIGCGLLRDRLCFSATALGSVGDENP